MRIIGGHDYYDGGLTYGFDPNIVFVRPKEEFRPIKFLPAPNRLRTALYKLEDSSGKKLRQFFNSSFFLTLDAIIVYVAGVRYSGIRVTNSGIGHLTQSYFWTYESMETYLNGFGATTRISKRNIRYGIYKNLSEHFEDFGTKREFEQCVNERVVVATYEPPSCGEDPAWQINGDNLKNFEFYRVLDTHQCYQEISMFVGGVLPGSENKMVEVSAPQKIKKHGFDKWSFRKPPQSKT